MTKRDKFKLKKAQKIGGLTVKKINKNIKKLGTQTSELYDQTREELKPKLKSTLEKTQKTAELTVDKTKNKIGELSNQTSKALKERKERKVESKNKLEEVQQTVDLVVEKTNEKIEDLGIHTLELFNGLTTMQVIFDLIRNVPTDKRLELEELKEVRVNWKNQAEQIEKDYQIAVTKGAGIGAFGTGAGVAVIALGPSVAMGIATTFGVASTGTAISALSGAAATNAALAWIGGGTLAAGGGGIVAGNLLLAFAGPLGWAVSGAAIISGGGLFLKAKNEKDQLENIFTLMSVRDTKSYNLAIIELNERIIRIKNEGSILQEIVEEIRDFGLDYEKMSNQQQHQLGTYLNFMHSSTQLLVNPILGLQAKYSEKDYIDFVSDNENRITKDERSNFKEMIIFLANLLYKIDLNKQDKKILWKTIRSNKELMDSMDISKGEFKESVMDYVDQALKYKYQLSSY